MITLILFLAGSAATATCAYWSGHFRAKSEFHAFLSDGYGQLLERTGAGEDLTPAALDVFSPDRLAAWTKADAKRVLARRR